VYVKERTFACKRWIVYEVGEKNTSVIHQRQNNVALRAIKHCLAVCLDRPIKRRPIRLPNQSGLFSRE
jgi:hypothetical protein